MKNIFRLFFILGISFCISNQSQAQVSVFTGLNSSSMRNEGVLANQQLSFGVHIGFALRHYSLDSLKKFSVQYELSFNQKGYQQKLDEIYTRRFNYLSAPLLINYAASESVSLSTGLEPSFLLFTNAEDGINTYNRFDLAWVLGLNVLEDKRLSFYARFSYGLVPTLDYYTFDELGNFTSEIHDLKNICFSFGLKFDIYHEKISFNK